MVGLFIKNNFQIQIILAALGNSFAKIDNYLAFDFFR